MDNREGLEAAINQSSEAIDAPAPVDTSDFEAALNKVLEDSDM